VIYHVTGSVKTASSYATTNSSGTIKTTPTSATAVTTPSQTTINGYF